LLLGTVSPTTTLSYADANVAPVTAYSYQVRAYDAASNYSPLSASLAVTTPAAPDTTPPSAPANLTATATAYNRVALSWTASTDSVGVTGYYVVRGGVTLASVTGTTYTDTSVTANTQYGYQIIARDAANNNATSSIATVTTPSAPDTTPPSVPQAVTTQAVSSSQINISWAASTDNIGVTSYKLYRGTTLIATTSATAATSYGDTNLSASTSFTYTLSACDGAGNCSAQSATATATTFAIQTTGSLTGIISNQAGSGISRAKVRITNGVNSYTAYTVTTGGYAFPTLTQGAYSATYSAKSYKPTTTTVVINGGSQTTNNVTLIKR
jgi:chitodextrinase